MSEFKVIETQEDLDKIIQKRLAQKDREIEETYKDYLSPEQVEDIKNDYQKKLDDANKFVEDAKVKLANHDKEVSDLTERAQQAETSLLKGKIALAKGIPYELANRLVGSTEEELTQDAEGIAKLIGGKQQQPTAPLYTNEAGSRTPLASNNDAALLGMLSQISEQIQSN